MKPIEKPKPEANAKPADKPDISWCAGWSESSMKLMSFIEERPIRCGAMCELSLAVVVAFVVAEIRGFR